MEEYSSEQHRLVEVVDQLLNVVAQYEKHRLHHQGTEIFPSEVRALRVIGENPELNVTEVARRLNVSKSAVCKMTQKLEKKGLVQRLKMKRNRRDVVISLTLLGRAVFDGVEEAYDEIRREIASRVDPATLQARPAIIDYLTRLKDVLASRSGSTE
ncbi:MAG: MarR family transcriptional regulator [Bacteroidota bacterium]